MFAGGAPPVPPAPIIGGGPHGHGTFDAFYTDVSKDDLGGNYHNIMTEFLVNGTPPQHLRQYVTNSDPWTSATGYLFLIQPANQPAHPGFLVTHHTVARYTREVGHGDSMWDDGVFSLRGDVVNGSLLTLYEFPDTAFRLPASKPRKRILHATVPTRCGPV
jgi:hypothetical protein